MRLTDTTNNVVVIGNKYYCYLEVSDRKERARCNSNEINQKVDSEDPENPLDDDYKALEDQKYS